MFYIKLIFCIDKNNGMMFGSRRQSQDRVLRQRLIELTAQNKLWMSVYSAKQFEDFDGKTADDGYMEKAGTNDYCFIEDGPFSVDGADEVILCHWNRLYPASRYFDIDLRENGFRKVNTENIVGSSHEKITIETYRRKEK